MPSQQQTFDTVVNHLRKQRTKAESHDPTGKRMTCMYRTPEGLRCAAGCLIPDDRYSPSLEFTVVGGTDDPDDRSNAVTRLLDDLGYDVNLVSDLQSIHDDKKVEQWEDEFIRVAEAYCLNYVQP
jgi:hypothetical protein